MSRRLLTRAAGALAGLALLLAAPAALATGSGVVTIGGDDTVATVPATISSQGNVAFRTTRNVPTTCSGLAITGRILRGAPVINGSVIGYVDSLASTGNCLMTALNFPKVIAGTNYSWEIEVVGTPAPKSRYLNVNIKNVSAYVRATGSAPYACEYQASAASIPAVFDTVDQRLRITTPVTTLFITSFNGAGTSTPAAATCANMIRTGDTMSMAGEFIIDAGGDLTF